MLRAGVLALALVVSTPVPVLADVKAGVDAWSAGDYAGAVREWQPLAEQDDADALFNLAQAYKLGRGVPMDIARAEDLYGRAAAKGHLQAADTYGVLLFQRGERTRALPYLEASAARGDPRAQYILGVAHFNGDIVPKDWVRGYALASLAGQAGLPQAAGALAQMDAHIPLADRQKSVILAQQIAAQAQANRQRLNTSAELGTRLAVAEPAPRGGAQAQGTAVQPLPAPSAAPKPAPSARKPAAPPAPRPTVRPAIAPAGPWGVQLGAFGVAGNAEALWARVRARPELAGHPRALVPAGKLTKLQATGFASRAAAEAACARLTAGGLGCLPVRD
ncbi:SPOR domain-containing protein [Novosphingobium soli]|uniref:SPOR domain-containing protein n=1 Tax=Novosphingobium soli TaxID=574956 RepID=A0ABV6CU56_9SPHN